MGAWATTRERASIPVASVLPLAVPTTEARGSCDCTNEPSVPTQAHGQVSSLFMTLTHE